MGQLRFQTPIFGSSAACERFQHIVLYVLSEISITSAMMRSSAVPRVRPQEFVPFSGQAHFIGGRQFR